MGDGPTNIRFDPAVVKQIKAIKDDEHTTVSAWIRGVVEAEVERRNRPQDTRARLMRVMVAFGPTVVFARTASPDEWGARLQDGYNDLLAVYESLAPPSQEPRGLTGKGLNTLHPE